jgi:hypothetical protein
MAENPRFGPRTISVCALALGVLLGGAVLGERLWVGKRYPSADPAATSRRLDRGTQDVYDALGLRGAPLDANWPGAGLEADPFMCSRTGLRHIADGLMDDPPSEPDTARIRESWALKAVTPADVVAAFRRARSTLTRSGWKVLPSPSPAGDLELTLRPPHSDDTVVLDTFPAGRLQVAAQAACARYPSSTPVDDLREPVLPAMRAPSQLRY